MLDTLPVTRTSSANGSAPRPSKAVASDFFAQMVAESATRYGSNDSSAKADNRSESSSRSDDRPVAERDRSARSDRAERSERAERPENNDPRGRAEAKPTEEVDSRSDTDAPADQDVRSSDANKSEASTEKVSAKGTEETTTDQEGETTAGTQTAAEEGTPGEDPGDATVVATVAAPNSAQQMAGLSQAQSTAENNAAADPKAAPSSKTAPQQAQVLAAGTSQQQQAPQAAKSSSVAGTPAAGEFSWNADLPDSALVQRLMQSQQKQALTIPTADRDLDLSLSVERNGQMVLPQNKLGNDTTLWALAQNGDQSGAGNFSQLLSAGVATAEGAALPGQMAQINEQTLSVAAPSSGKAGEIAPSLHAALPGDITAPRGVDAATLSAAKPAATTSQPAADQVAVQITKAVNGGKDKISLQLNPAELGRVDVKLDVGTDGSVKAVISVDRPETMDLMQRDSRMLEKALQEAGLKTDSGSLSFNLKGEGQNGQGQETAGNGGGSLSGSDDGGDLTDLDDQPAPPADPSDWHEGVVSIAV